MTGSVRERMLNRFSQDMIDIDYDQRGGLSVSPRITE
jgi:hypothetical protein